jgi:hypothetical protein
MRVHNRRAHSELLTRLVHRFWTILCGIFAGFIVLEQLFQGFHFRHSLQAELLEIPSQRVPLNTRLVVVHFGSDRRLRRSESTLAAFVLTQAISFVFMPGLILAK